MTHHEQFILAELDETREKWWLNAFLYNLGLCASCTVYLLWLITTLDCRWTLEPQTRIVLFFLWAVVSLGMFGAILVYSLTQRRSLAATARRLERSFPELENQLISVVQLMEVEPHSPFLPLLGREAAEGLARVPLADAPYRYSLWQRWQLGIHTTGDLWGIAATTLLGITLAILSYIALPGWDQSLGRAIRPWQFPSSDRSSAAAFAGPPKLGTTISDEVVCSTFSSTTRQMTCSGSRQTSGTGSLATSATGFRLVE